MPDSVSGVLRLKLNIEGQVCFANSMNETRIGESQVSSTGAGRQRFEPAFFRSNSLDLSSGDRPGHLLERCTDLASHEECQQTAAS